MHGPGWNRGWPGHGWHGHPERWRGPRPPAALAVVIALVQALGTTVAARGQEAALDPLGYGLLVGSGLALTARARWPAPTYAVTVAATVAYHALGYPTGPTFVALIIAGVGAVKAGQRYPVWAVTAAGFAAWVWLTTPTLRQAVVLAIWTLGVLLLAEWSRVGAAYRARSMQAAQERARAEEEAERRQTSEERLRIARELHDVVGHHLSLINVQAGVGLHLMDTRPEQAREALGAIKQASAEALREVRAVLAAVRPEGEAAPLTPALGLGRLSELTGDAGLPVTVEVRGTARELPVDLDRAAYRIVQEALTNVRRHAGEGAAATVVVEYREREVAVQVDDDGAGAAELVEGNGIAGMRERAAALGGTLTAGPGPTGGFRVRATVPLAPA